MPGRTVGRSACVSQKTYFVGNYVIEPVLAINPFHTKLL
jgi:hypothetical protein